MGEEVEEEVAEGAGTKEAESGDIYVAYLVRDM